MEVKKFHISVIAAVAHSQIWLARGGIHEFSDLLQYMTDSDHFDIWNCDHSRKICSESILAQFPFLKEIDLCSNSQSGLEAWHIGLELEFGTNLEVVKNDNVNLENVLQEKTSPVIQIYA